MNKNYTNFKNLTDILRYSWHAYPKRTAIIFGQNRYTYEQLYQKANLISVSLRMLGIKKGDRVAILLDNCPEFIFYYYGILMSEGIVVSINHMFKRDEIKYILQDSESICLITSSVYREIAEELNVMLDSLQQVVYINEKNEHKKILKSPTRNALHAQAVDSDKDDVAVFLYTSGTTGHPKAAMLTHRNLLSNVLSSSKAIDVTHRDTFICFLPLFHSFAATVCMHMPLFNGAKVVILKSPKPIKKLIRSIRKNRITIFVGIPSIYSILKDIKWPRFLSPFLLSIFNPIRLAISGAAALPADVFKKFEQKYRIPLLEGYGLTEASPVVSLNPLKGNRKPGSIGLVIPNVTVKIIDDTGKELGTDQIGELCVQGPNVMQGYYKKEDENKNTLRNDWLLTGDMAKIDSEGYIYIMGRKKEMVNVRGLNVYPREIEEVLYQNPDIKEAAVIGIPDPHKGEVPKGFVVLKTKNCTNEHEIISYLKGRLASYKIPKSIEIREELPKNSQGKILKRLLIEEILKKKGEFR